MNFLKNQTDWIEIFVKIRINLTRMFYFITLKITHII